MKLDSKEQLINILNGIKDYVYVTGSYASNTFNSESDIDFLIKDKPQDVYEKELEENNYDNSLVDETYCKFLINYFEEMGYNWDSILIQSFNVDDTFIPLEFSSYYECDMNDIFDIDILGVTMKAVRSNHNSDKYLNGIKIREEF